MYLNKQEIEILELLISATDYMSSYDIAAMTGMNRRLVRDKMAAIRIILKDLGYHLISKTSKGYMIERKSSLSLQSLAKIIEKAQQQRESALPTLPWERQNYIVKRLIENNGYVKIDELAEELFISRSTMTNDLKSAKSSIQKYQLTFNHKPNYGICILGDEVNKRKPLCDFLFTNLKQSEMFYDYLHSYFTDKDSLEYGIIDIIKKHHIEMSDFALCDFLLSLSVSITRILAGFYIQDTHDLSAIHNQKEISVAQDIAHFLALRNHCSIPQNEINQIAIELICKRSCYNIPLKNNEETHKLLHNILERITEQTLLQFNTPDFQDHLSAHIEMSLIRIDYQEKIRTPLYDDLKSAYPLAYECAEITDSVIYEYKQQHLSKSELASFAILFHQAIYQNEKRKKQVLLVCGLSDGFQNICKYHILEKFENQIDIIKDTLYHKLFDEDLSCYDFIISTVPIHKDIGIPYINISQIIGKDDLDKIENTLSYVFYKQKMETLFHPQLYRDHVTIYHFHDLLPTFSTLLNAQFPHMKDALKNKQFYHKQLTLIPCKNKIGILKLHKPFHSTNILAVLILKNPLIVDTHEYQIIIFFSCLDPNHYIYNTLSHTLNSFSQNPQAMEALIQRPSYQAFLKALMTHQ